MVIITWNSSRVRLNCFSMFYFELTVPTTAKRRMLPKLVKKLPANEDTNRLISLGLIAE
jgi:hypothetical protein